MPVSIVLQRVAVCYRVLQCVAVCCSLYTSFYAFSTENNIFTIGDACNDCVAACCGVLQRVAACCSVLQNECTFQMNTEWN